MIFTFFKNTQTVSIKIFFKLNSTKLTDCVYTRQYNKVKYGRLVSESNFLELKHTSSFQMHDKNPIYPQLIKKKDLWWESDITHDLKLNNHEKCALETQHKNKTKWQPSSYCVKNNTLTSTCAFRHTVTRL